jgi:transposase
MSSFSLTDNYSASQIADLAKVEHNPRTQKRLWAIRMLLLRQSPEAVCQIFDCLPGTLEEWVARFNQDGPQGLGDKPRSGPRKRLKAEDEERFHQRVLNGPLPGDNIHTFRLLDLQLILKNEFGAEFTTLPGVWTLCKRLKLSHLMPRPYNPRSDQEAQETFKKTSRTKSRANRKSSQAKQSRSGLKMKCVRASTAP